MQRTLSHIISLLLLCATLVGCDMVDKVMSHFKPQQSKIGVVAQIGNNMLYKEELDAITLQATSPEDSAALAEQYIKQWATPILLYNSAKRNIGNSQDIETLVENYRRDLYVHQYEEEIITQRMPRDISKAEIQQFFDKHGQQFVLKNDIVKGIIIVTPQGIPQLSDLRQWLKHGTDDIDQIEHYAYQFATGYQLFTDQWQPAHEVVMNTPLDFQTLSQQLHKTNLIESQDSVNTYMLRITDCRFAGEQMPIEYAEPQIKTLLLNQKKMELLRQFEQKTYQTWKNEQQ